MGAVSIAFDGSAVLMLFPREIFSPAWLKPAAGLRGKAIYPDVAGRAKAHLLPGRLRTSCPRIRRAEQAVGRHRDRIGRGIAEWLDELVAARFQVGQYVIRKTVLDSHLVRQPLMMQARRCDSGRDIHLVVDD